MMLENESAENKNEVKKDIQLVENQPIEKDAVKLPVSESQEPENPEEIISETEVVDEQAESPVSEISNEKAEAENPVESVSEIETVVPEIYENPIAEVTLPPEEIQKVPEESPEKTEETDAISEETSENTQVLTETPETTAEPLPETPPEQKSETEITPEPEITSEPEIIPVIADVQKPITLAGKAETEEEPAEELPDYTSFGKKELLTEVERLLAEKDIKKIDPSLRPLKAVFEEIRENEKTAALQQFIAEGGEEGDFEFKPDEETRNFERLYRQLRERKNKHTQELEKTKEQNYKRKLEILEQMRMLVETEESNDSFNQFKKIQQEWKSIGVLPAGAAKELWANYEILTERYFAKRTIYNELKDLDRKRNLTQKIEICEKAERMAEIEQVTGQMMKELSDLHDEYKHVGPVPKESQEEVWQRFKLASDKIYDKRRQQQDIVKQEWEENYKKKEEIIVELEKYAAFQTDKIGEWNSVTQTVLGLQKQWDASGSISREQAKEINKRFWAAFKQFFNSKGEFFRKLEEYREQNLKEKTQLCEEAEALKESEEIERTTERMKFLQQRWKEIGPVPEKVRDKIYERFKAACDYFFDRKRGKAKESEGSYESNLRKKTEICEKLEQMATEKTGDLKILKDLQNEYGNLGFVPKKDMQTIRKRFAEAVEVFLENMPTTSGQKTDKKLVKLEMEIENAHNNPQSQKDFGKQENFLRKKLTQLENDVAVWQNNMEFFARSKNADSVRKEFTAKIEEAEKEIKSLKNQIRLLQQA